MGYWIQTYNNRQFFLDDPKPDDIDPQTIAVVLARTCRFGGHSRDFYSLAQHSVLVCDICTSVELKLAALLHDAHEVYSGFGDVLRPAKQLLKSSGLTLNLYTDRIDAAIAERFRFPAWHFDHQEIQRSDNVALASEARDMMGPHPSAWEALPDPVPYLIEPWGIDEAYRRFTARLYELWGE